MNNNLQKLISSCNASVNIEVNKHKDYYSSVKEHLNTVYETYNCGIFEDISEDVLQKMIETDTIIHIQFYPNTPVGFNEVWHYDIDDAINIALKMIS